MAWRLPVGLFKQRALREIEGLAEHCDARTLRGWAYRPAQPDTPVMLELWVGSQPAQVTKANLFREDLALRLGTRGLHGFEFRIDQIGLGEHDILGDTVLSVRLAHSDLEVPTAAVFHRPSRFVYGEQRYGTFAFERGLTSDNLLFRPADIDELRRRANEMPFSRILDKLRRRATEARQSGLELLAAEPIQGRGFLWRNTLQDAALLAVLDDDPDFLSFTDSLLEFLCEHPAAPGAYLPNEVALGFVCVGLLNAMELTSAAGLEVRNRDAAIGLFDRIGDHLKLLQRSNPWGRRTRERLAWNHSAIGYSVLGLAALVNGVQTEKHAEWLSEATWRCQAFLRHGVDDAGMTREGISYCGFTLGIVGPFLRALFRAYPVRHYFHSAPGCAESKFERMVEWYRFDSIPRGGLLGAWNDSRSDPYIALRGLLHLPAPSLAVRVKNQWHDLVGDMGDRSFGDAPNYRHSLLFDSYAFLTREHNMHRELPTSRFYPTDGYVHARSSWARNAVSLTFKCGPHTHGVHGQSDNNSFTLTSSGRPFLIDSGTSNIREPGSRSQWEWHNVVAVNGKGQRLSGRGHGVSGTIVERDEGPDHIYIAGDATQSYEDGVTRAVRHILFARWPMPFVIVFDDVGAEGGIEFVEWYFHVDGRLSEVHEISPGQFNFQAAGRESALLLFAAAPDHKRPRKFPVRRNYLHRFQRASSTPFLVLPYHGKKPPVTLSTSLEAGNVDISMKLARTKLKIQFAVDDSLGYSGSGRLRPRGPVFQIIE